MVTGLAAAAAQAIPFGGTTADQYPSISGTASPGHTITVNDGSDVIGSVTVGLDGQWSIRPTVALLNGLHDLYAVDTTRRVRKARSPITSFSL